MKKFIVCIAIFFLSLSAVWSLLGSSYFPMHDDTQVGRVVSMSRSLLDGQFPVRWVSDLGFGYGYPLFNFYGPLPYYIGGALVAMGIDPMYATKVMMGIGMLLAPFLLFFVLESFLGLMGAAVSSILFIYAPYHAVQLYVRGAVGELYATAFLPLIFYGIISPFLGKKTHNTILVGAVGIALTILSHTILGFVLVCLYSAWIILYGLISSFQKKRFAPILFSYIFQIGAGLLLSASFWLPAFLEMGYTNVAGQISETAYYKDHFICAMQLLYSPWGFGGSTATCMDGMSYKLGLMHIAVFVYALFVAWSHRLEQSSTRIVYIAGIATTCVALFFALPASAWIWQHVPKFSYIQYPWRFLSIASLGMAVVGGYAFSRSASFARRMLVVLVLLLVIVSNNDEFTAQRAIQKPLDAYVSVEELHFRVSSVSHEYLPKAVIRPRVLEDLPSNIFSAQHFVIAEIQSDTSTHLKAKITSSEDQDVVVQKTWFPGWQYMMDGVSVDPKITNGFPTFHVSKGESVIELRLSGTPIEHIGNLISVLTLVVGLAAYIFYEKNNA